MGGTIAASLAIFFLWYRHARAEAAKLARERAEAEAAVQQKSRLLATMSHEIRTPLNGVIGMLGLLLETELTPEQKNYANIANSSGRSLLSFLDELLATAKSEALAGQPQGQFDLEIMLESVTELMAPRAHLKGIEISSYIAPHVPRLVQFNELHLRQILFNLVGNAIKFTETGGVEIYASLNANDCLQIEVRDTGLGMNDTELKKLFGEFSQANAQTARRFGGTGLGLSISKRLAQSMGADITVTSKPARGTVFSLTFGQVEDKNIQSPTLPLVGRTFGLAVTPGISQRHMLACLADLGAVVEAWTENGRPQAVICDPSNADAVLRCYRKAKTRPQIWIMLSAEERRQAGSLLSAPATTGYLVKPVRRSALITLLTEKDVDTVSQASAGLRQIVKTAKSPNHKPSQKHAKSWRLLLAEDTAVNAMLVTTLLTKAGHQVVHVQDGQAAVDLLARDRNFDLVLMDVEMPILDGHAAASSIRQNEREQGLKPMRILALTANGRPEDISACRDAGMNGHLAKPFDRQDLEEALAMIMADRVKSAA